MWRQTPARYNWPLIRVRQKVNSSLGPGFPHSATSLPPLLRPILPCPFASRGLVPSSTHWSPPFLALDWVYPALFLAPPGPRRVSPSRVRNGVIDGFLAPQNDRSCNYQGENDSAVTFTSFLLSITLFQVRNTGNLATPGPNAQLADFRARISG